MSEAHIAHAISVFSELGIASGLGWLINVVNIRSDLTSQLVVAEESQRVTKQNNHAIANECDDTKNFLIRGKTIIRERFYTYLIGFLLGLLRWLPYISIVFGVVVLFGISFYPEPEITYFVISFSTFMIVAWIPLVAFITKIIINRYAVGNIKIS